jgi:hypothetical protein
MNSWEVNHVLDDLHYFDAAGINSRYLNHNLVAPIVRSTFSIVSLNLWV